MSNQLGTWKDVTATAQSIATVIAAVAAAWWFLTQGTTTPHANLTQSIQTVKIHEKWRLVRLSVRLSNVGSVPIPLSAGQVYIARVFPLEESIRKDIDAGDSPIDPRNGAVSWPSIGKPYEIVPHARIWPGESESYDFDFLIPADLCEIMLHSHFSSMANRHWRWSEDTFQKVGECNNAS